MCGSGDGGEEERNAARCSKTEGRRADAPRDAATPPGSPNERVARVSLRGATEQDEAGRQMTPSQVASLSRQTREIAVVRLDRCSRPPNYCWLLLKKGRARPPLPRSPWLRVLDCRQLSTSTSSVLCLPRAVVRAEKHCAAFQGVSAPCALRRAPELGPPLTLAGNLICSIVPVSFGEKALR